VASGTSSDGNGDGIVAATNIKQEPGIAGEVTLSRWVRINVRWGASVIWKNVYLHGWLWWHNS
jgi:hypothetical protein